MARRTAHRGVRRCVIWIFLFTALAAAFWPGAFGLGAIALAFVGVLHLAVLVHEAVTEAQFDERMTPLEFEHYCAQVLRERKWDARVTQASGDQGVDMRELSLGMMTQCLALFVAVRNKNS